MKRSLLALLFILSTLLVSETNAQTSAQVRVSPVAGSLAVDQVLDLMVEIQDVEDLYGFDVWLAYDPAVVEIVDANPTQDGIQVSLGLLMDPGFVVLNTADNTGGRLQFAMTQLNPSEPKSGSGPLVVLTVRGRQAGSSSLEIVRADLSRRDGTPILATTMPGRVTVLESAGAQATNTPIPTQDPGTPLAAFTATPVVDPATPVPSSAAPGQAPVATATSVLPAATPTADLVAPTMPVETATAIVGLVAGPDPTAAAPAASPLPTAGEALPQATSPAQVELALAAVDAEPTATATSAGSGLREVVVAPSNAGQPAGVEQSNAAQPAGVEQSNAAQPERMLLGLGLVSVMLAGAIALLIVFLSRRQRQDPNK